MEYNSSDEELEDIAIASSVFVVQMMGQYRKRRMERSVWVNPYLKERQTKGRFAKDFDDMRANEGVFKENFHMAPAEFDSLLHLLEPMLRPKKSTRPTDEITPIEKLAITFEYFASGSLQRHVASTYRISKQHFGHILDEVSSAVCQCLKNEIEDLKETDFVRIANEFNLRWNMPNCIGAIDGKHVAIKCPKNSGSLFYNYKDFYSIVLMAITDANYKFIFIDVGAYGSEGDAGVFGASKFGKNILEGTLPFPENVHVGTTKLPYYFVADDAFPLNKRIMKPYSSRRPLTLTDEERIFNYRLSRARRCVENAFGILCSKWICLGRTMFCGPDRAQKIISACCYLHNYLIRNYKISYCPPNFVDYYDDDGTLVEGTWRKNLSENSLYFNTLSSATGRPNDFAKSVRDKLKEYVNSKSGSLEWQRKAVFLK